MKWRSMSVKEIKEEVLKGYNFTCDDIKKISADPRKAIKNLAIQLHKKELEKERVSKLYEFERKLNVQGIQMVAGIDEAGRGPLAGPVVAAAVILPPECLILGLNDSKKISETKRYLLEQEIKSRALAWAIGTVGVHDIDKYNILQATYIAMKRAIKKLIIEPQHILVDAVTIPDLSQPQTPIIAGDAKSASIAAASILAKCHRDNLMKKYHEKFPGYGFEKNKGYPTMEHVSYIREYGYTSIHRKTFSINRNEK